MHHLLPYLPSDRRQALITRTELPTADHGSVLFADLAGFTPLTERLLHLFGARRGAEELTALLDQVYAPLIATVHAHGGSVISFSGDAITCWFSGADACPAIACGLSMQQAMVPIAAVALAPDQSVALTIKVAIAAGPVQRFVVGDPTIQRIDILAGAPLERLAVLDPLARPGEVLVDARLARSLQEQLAIPAWRADVVEEQGAVVTGIRSAVAWDAHPPALPPDPPAGLAQWIAPAVLARLQDSQQPFLTELRPTVALFLHFTPHAAPADLDAYIRWVQHVLRRYDATLLQVSVGDKGAYLYASFGAPIAHEDDAIRTVRAALELRNSPHMVQTTGIGIAAGIARAGVYGSASRRTYGVLGDAVNLAARLMQTARPGQILASEPVWSTTRSQFHWDPLPPLTVKGKPTPLHIARLGGPRATPTFPALSALVGRAAELAAMQAQLELARQGRGQLLLITGEAGIGKSRLTREAARLLGAASVLLAGTTQSYATASPYLAWTPIWQAIFGVIPGATPGANLARVTAALARLAPPSLAFLPLLSSVLSLPIPDTDLTRTLEPTVRKERLEALLAASLRAHAGELAASGRSLLLELEDLHWIDALSADLLLHLAPLIADLPVAVIVTSRPTAEAQELLDGLAALPHASTIALGELSPAAVGALLSARVPEGGHERLIAQVQERANGNPFYVEELISYLQTDATPIDARDGWEGRELPTGLHRLVLSRIDRLDERQQRVLKTASVLGGSFPRHWLWEFYPALGAADQIQADLDTLERSDLLAVATDLELCHFKHAITREVTYASLGRGTRAELHEQCAVALEQAHPGGEAPLDLLAYHYEQSRVDAKAVEYLARNAARAMRLFANQAAADQYRRAIQRAGQTTTPLPIATLERGLGEVYAQMAAFDPALASYDRAVADLPADDVLGRAEIAILQADVLVRATRFEEAVALIEATETDLRTLAPGGGKLPPAGRVLLARLAELRSIKSQRQSDAVQALQWAERGLANITWLPASYANVASTRTRLYQAAAAAAMILNDYPQARRMLNNALRVIQRHPHPVIEAELQLRQALLLQRTEQLRASIRRFRAVLPLMEATGTRDRLAYVLLPGGQTLGFSGAYAEAEAWLTRGIQLGKEIGSAFLVCAGLAVLCKLSIYTGRWETGLNYSAEGKRLAERHDLRWWFTQFLTHEGEIRLYRGEFAHATALFQQLQTYADQYPLYMALAQRYLAYGAFMAGDIEQAVHAMRGTAIGSTTVISTEQAFDVLGIAEWWVLLKASNVPVPHDEAVLQEAVANSIVYWQQRGYGGSLSYAWRIYAMLDWYANRLDHAFNAIQRGLSIARQIGNIPEHARCLFWSAKIAFATNALDRGSSDLDAAARMFAALGAWPEHHRSQALAQSPHDRSIVL